MKEIYTSIYQSGNHIHVRGIGADGEPFAKKNVFEPYIFVDANKDHGYKDIHGNFVKKVNFDNMNEAKDYLKKFDDVSGMRILGLTHWTYLYIYEHYMDIEPDMEKIKVYYLDIEVQSDDGFPKPEDASKPVTAIALTDKQRKICFGTGDYKPPKGQKDIYYIKCDNEKALLHKFLEIWQKISLDVISGWNIKTFDIPYLVNRIRKVLGEDYVKQLSPWGSVRQSNMKGMNGEEIQTYNIAGISNLDYMVLYKKFQLEPRESYKLDSVCEVITKGTTPTTAGYDYIVHGVGFLRAENLQDVELDNAADLLFVSREYHELQRRSQIFPGDVLLSIAGTVGRSALVPLEYPGPLNCNQAVAIIRPRDLTQGEAIFRWLQTHDAKRQFSQGVVKGTIQNLSLGIIGKLKIPDPKCDSMTSLVSVLKELERIQSLMQVQISCLARLQTTMLEACSNV